MCGIAGVIRPQTLLEVASIAQSLEVLRHRGPDGQGWLTYSERSSDTGCAWRPPDWIPEVALFHRRLSILDLSAAGQQPMATRDGRYHIVYNGELYNYLELRDELAGLGVRFDSRSDTEVLLAAYAQWGAASLQRFEGMFAFAILDVRRRTVFLARDVFGIKPLYYVRDGACVRFASEIKALVDSLPRPRRINSGCALQYLRYGRGEEADETLFEGIRQLPAAHYLELSLDGDYVPEAKRYWSLPSEERTDLSFEQAAERVKELFLKSVALHLRSDVPVGSALSGGNDSSAIVMCMRYLDPRADIHTFSFIPDDPALSEESWIDTVATSARVTAHKVYVHGTELANDLGKVLHCQDQPFGGSSVYSQYRLFRLARCCGIKVMMDGQGADEFLGGYRYFLGARLASLLRRRRWAETCRFLIRCARHCEGSASLPAMYAADYLLSPALNSVARRCVGRDVLPSWIASDWMARNGVTAEPANTTVGADILKTALRRDLAGNSLPCLLRFEDRNSMAHSVESRVPFLNKELVTFVLSLPEHYIVDCNGTSKAVFRRAMRGIVPDCVLDRRDKLGFPTPEKRWLKSIDSWVVNVLTSEAAHTVACLNVADLLRSWKRMRSDRQRFDSRIWRSVTLIKWAEALDVNWN